MSDASSHDLIVIGGGIAGLIAATRAAELGLRVCVLEKGTDERYLCNTRYTGGTLHVCLHDIMTDAAVLRAAVLSATEGGTGEAMADAIATDGRRVVRWLQSQGIRFVKASPAAYQNWVLAPPRPARAGLEWQGRGGDVLLRSLGELIAKRGGSLVRGARARALTVRDGRCTGVRADIDGRTSELTARAVVVADGGFQGNLDLVREHISPQPDRLKQRGAATSLGDGLTMAREAGARTTDLGWFYGHVLSRDAMTRDGLWPYPVIDTLAAASMVVDGSGRRFADEGRSGVYLANCIAKLADPLSALVLFDDAIWNEAGKRDLVAINPNVPANGGTILRAGTLAELAQQANLPAQALADSVAEYNSAVQSGTTGKLTPSRRSDRFKPSPIAKAPFYAMPLCAGITYTMGGIAVDEQGCVLRANDESRIEGLYAAGSCAGGVDGGPSAGYVGGLVKCGVLGLRSAEHLARALGKAI
jgi:fumarate reductase flavoprotein subunit